MGKRVNTIMKPKVLEEGMKATSNVSSGNIPAFNNNTGTELKDVGISAQDIKTLIEHMNAMIAHYQDTELHISDQERVNWNKRESIVVHTMNTEVHVNREEREYWNEKESVEGAQAKANAVMAALNTHAYDTTLHVTPAEKTKLKNCYSKEDVDMLLDKLETKIDWKESVNTYEDLFITYPDPYDGWTVNVLDSDLTYRFDGDDWVCISANIIPNATEEVDGKLSKEDKAKLNSIEENANHYVHPNDKYTRHVTDAQIAEWSSKAGAELATHMSDGLMQFSDKVKLDAIEENANYYIHPATHPARIIDQTDDLMFVTRQEKDTWSAKAENRLATWYINGLMSGDDKKKLDNVSENANLYVHPLNHDPSIIQETEDKQFVSAKNKETWHAKFGRGDFIRGSAVFNGTEGIRIPHDLNDPNLNYSVLITVTSCNTPQKIGVIWVDKSALDIVVYASGGDIADSFDYLIIKE